MDSSPEKKRDDEREATPSRHRTARRGGVWRGRREHQGEDVGASPPLLHLWAKTM